MDKNKKQKKKEAVKYSVRIRASGHKSKTNEKTRESFLATPPIPPIREFMRCKVWLLPAARCHWRWRCRWPAKVVGLIGGDWVGGRRGALGGAWCRWPAKADRRGLIGGGWRGLAAGGDLTGWVGGLVGGLAGWPAEGTGWGAGRLVG